MIARLLRPIVLIIASSSLLLAQSTVGEWEHFLSSAQVRAVIYADQKAFLATAAGVIVYDAQTTEINQIGLNEGLAYPDINALAISGEWLWLGGAAPVGIMQLYNLETGRLEIHDLGVDEILEIETNGNRAYAAYRDGQNFGLMEFKYSSDRYSFADTYSNFSISDVVDFDIHNDTLYLSASTAVLYADAGASNLKDPTTWTELPALAGTSIIKVHANDYGLYYMDQDRVYKHTETDWVTEWEFSRGTVYDLTGDDEGNIILSRYGQLYSFGTDDHLVVSSDAGQRVLDYAVATDLGGGFAAVKDLGLAFYNNEQRSWTKLFINDVLGQNYSSIIRLRNGTLVAAGLPGIAYRKKEIWYNILPGYNLRTEIGSSHINDFSDADGTGFYADTLYYRAKQSWNMLEQSDGSVLVGFKGNPAYVTPMLKFHPDNIAGFESYDTTGQVLDGLINSYVTIRHIAEDAAGNVWVVNPFAELRGNTLAVLKTDGEWEHYSVAESGNRLNMVPTEIAFDDQGRAWIGSQENSHWSSNGGLVMLDYGDNLSTKIDDDWISVSIKQDMEDSNTIWSLAFDKNGVLWLLTPQGVIGHNVEPGPILRPYTNFGYFLGDIPFEEGSKIRIDARNNKWITSPSQGVWVLLDNTTFWPDVHGFNAENSDLLSSEILDLFISDEEGLVYFATAKGISILRTPFKEEYASQPDLKIFPSPFLIPAGTPLTIDGLMSNSLVKIFTMNGALVRELTGLTGEVEGYQALWDGRNESGSLVGSGVYLVAGYQADGGSVVGKVAVIRR
ncbi:two-component regulator propeller domain-containing protein [Candidatus Neomarinimicrobiota bacterium]